jgi:methionine-rich copper-binding protein CopC
VSRPKPSAGRAARRAVTALTGVLLVVAATQPVQAHAVLVRSTPSHRAVLGQAPERVDLWFNERLEAAYSTVTIWNDAGRQVDERDATVTADDPRRLTVTFATRAAGQYTVKYRVLSVDGHIVDILFTFTVKGQRQ